MKLISEITASLDLPPQRMTTAGTSPMQPHSSHWVTCIIDRNQFILQIIALTVKFGTPAPIECYTCCRKQQTYFPRFSNRIAQTKFHTTSPKS